MKGKFCGHCGSKLHEKYGLCPVCDKKKIRSKGRAKVIVISLVSLLLCGAITVGAIFLIPMILNVDEGKKETNETITYGDFIDTDEYYGTNAEVVSVVDAKTSDKVTTAADTYRMLTDRGFGDFPITASYNMDGQYLKEVTISEDSNEKYPMYSTYYASASGELWVVNVINGTLTAYPVMYNQQSQGASELILTESDTVMSYDGTLNKFYETKPYESAAVTKQVAVIDAQTLDKLTAEEIDAL